MYYKISLNTSVPYNSSFYCPDSNIMLTLGLPYAIVTELTPSINRGLHSGTLLKEEIEVTTQATPTESDDVAKSKVEPEPSTLAEPVTEEAAVCEKEEKKEEKPKKKPRKTKDKETKK